MKNIFLKIDVLYLHHLDRNNEISRILKFRYFEPRAVQNFTLKCGKSHREKAFSSL